MAEKVKIELTGVFAWLKANKGKIKAKRIREIAAAAGAQAWYEWATGSGPGAAQGKLADRGSERAWDALRLTPRSEQYQKRQRKVFGKTLPYRSPKSNGVHMMNIIDRPGIGWNAKATGRDPVVVKITFPGARALNLFSAKSGKQIYKDEFLQLNEQAKDEGSAVSMRALALLWQFLRDEISGTGATTNVG